MLEQFRASCPVGMHVRIEEASLGRMTQSRCITDTHSVGCSDNVTGVVRSRCDGRPECSFFVSSLGSWVNACPRNLMSYLYVHHVCVPGEFEISFPCEF